MITLEKVDLSRMNLEDLRGTTLAICKEEVPNKEFIFTVEEPQALVHGEPVALIRDWVSLEGYVVNLDTLVRGGREKGLILPGIVEELRLRYPAKPPHRYMIE